MKNKLTPALVALALVAGAILMHGCGRGDSNRIRVSGNIELTEVNVSFKIPGRLIERAVTEGDQVRKGMVVARLDREQLLGQRDRSQAALAGSQSLREQQII